MLINTPYLKDAIRRIYTDLVTVKRNVHSVSQVGRTILEEQLIYTDVPCRVSKRGQSQNTQTENTNLLNSSHVLYMAPDFQINQGDEMYINRLGQNYHFIAGDPFIYETHQEVPINQKGYA